MALSTGGSCTPERAWNCMGLFAQHGVKNGAQLPEALTAGLDACRGSLTAGHQLQTPLGCLSHEHHSAAAIA